MITYVQIPNIDICLPAGGHYTTDHPALTIELQDNHLHVLWQAGAFPVCGSAIAHVWRGVDND